VVSFHFRNEGFFARSRKAKDYAETYGKQAAERILQIYPPGGFICLRLIDAQIAEKSHFWIETRQGLELGQSSI